MRALSQEKSQSIIVTILENNRPDLVSSLSEAHHSQCLEYYTALLSIRDREQITRVLCRQNPDLFTQALRDAVASFEPIIRTIHEKVDIREHLSAMETFLNDFIATSRPKKHQSAAKKSDSLPYTPSVEDYVRLLQRNKQLLYNWLHQFAANCPETRDLFRAWAKETIGVFRQGTSGPDGTLEERPPGSPRQDGQNTPLAASTTKQAGAGNMSSAFQAIYQTLPQETQSAVADALDQHADYLSNLAVLSTTRMQRILDNLAPSDPLTSKSGTSTPRRPGAATGSTVASTTPASLSGTNTPRQAASMSGPGIFLCRWQALLDRTIVTPATPEGRPRTGRDVKASAALGKSGIDETWQASFLAFEAAKDVPAPPDVDAVTAAFGPGFRRLVVGLDKRLA
jgi:hypothetical protein